MKSAEARQIALGLGAPPPRFSRRDFVLAASNADVLATLDRWRLSGEPLLIVTGPTASGKTHLLHILAAEAGSGLLAIDDADRTDDPMALLSFVERARETGSRLAVAGRGDPAGWAQGLRDLQSRLSAATRIDLAEPDDALLQAVILKMLADRQLRAGPDLPAYAAARLPKTFSAAQEFIAALDAASIASGAPIGIKLARTVLANLSEEPRPA